MTRVLLAALLVGVLCSCGGRSSAQNDDTPREDGDTAEATSVGEITASEGSSNEETTGSKAPAPVAAPVEGPASRNTDARPAVGTNGMVSAAHPLATKAGLEVLEDGGNQR